MQEIFLVAVIQSIQQLSHYTRIVQFIKIHHSRLQQTHQIVIHVFEDQIKRSLILQNHNFISHKPNTARKFYFFKVKCILFVRDNFPQIHYIFMVELSQDFYLANSRDRKAFLFILQPDFFQSHQLISMNIFGFVYLTVRA